MHCPRLEHLQHCDTYTCPHMFKCARSYCIDSHMVCDGIADCPDGEDEGNCNDFLCAGLLKCRRDDICVHPVDICDGIVHCLFSGDDEKLCDNLPCPDDCVCRGTAVYCHELQDLFLISKQITALILRDVEISQLNAFQRFRHIVHLEMGNCSFIDNILTKDTLIGLGKMLHLMLMGNHIKIIRSNAFMSMVLLKHIDLQQNKIKVIYPVTFNNLQSLFKLNLSYFYLTKLHKLSFSGLLNLQTLNLSYNHLQTLKQSMFDGLENIRNIDLRFNSIQYIEGKTFLNMQTNVMISVHSFSYCCYLRKDHRCSINNYLIQTRKQCNTLFKHSLIKLFNATLSLLAIVVNIFFQWYIRTMTKKSSSYILLLRHSIAVNLVPHLYMLSLVTVSLYNNDNYIYLNSEWIQSYLCFLLYVLSTVGFVMPKILVFLMSLSQFVAVKFVFKLQSTSNYRYNFRGILCCWIIITLFASLNRFFFPVDNIFCFSFLVDTDSSFINNIFIVILLILMLLQIFGVAFMNHLVIQHVRKSNASVKSSKASNNERLLMKNAVLIVTVEILTLFLLFSILLYSHFISLHNHHFLLYISVVVHTYVFMYTSHLSLKIF